MPNRGNIQIQIGETCGIEFETDSIPRDFGNLLGFSNTHDASIETDYVDIGRRNRILVAKDDKYKDIFKALRGRENVVVGSEFVSPILNSSEADFLTTIKAVTNFLCSKGESPQSERSGIHFHFSMPNPNLRMLKSIVRLGRHLESVFFTLGGMGYIFRGVINDSAYCRPITKFGPPCVPYGGGYIQCFNVKHLLEAKSVDEFWDIYGDCRNHASRYNPVRYTWLNLYPLFPGNDYKGTLEFRIFNKTLNPEFIYYTALLCKAFVGFAIASSFQTLKDSNLLKENSIYARPSKQTVEDIFTKFADICEMDSTVYRNVLHILNLNEVPILPNTYISSHLLLTKTLNSYWENNSYTPEKIDPKLVNKPKIVDIHRLRGEIP